MNENCLLSMLRSSDPDVVLRGLSALGGEREHLPSSGLLRQAQAQFHHEDPDVRRQAVIAVGLHWQYVPAFADLLALLDVEGDEDVARAAIGAIAAIGKDVPALSFTALEALALAFNNPAWSERIRAVVYANARWMCNEISPQEHAAELLYPEKVSVDALWFDNARRRFLSNR